MRIDQVCIVRDSSLTDEHGCVVCGKETEEGSNLFCSLEHAEIWSGLVFEHVKGGGDLEDGLKPHNAIVLCNN